MTQNQIPNPYTNNPRRTGHDAERDAASGHGAPRRRRSASSPMRAWPRRS